MRRSAKREERLADGDVNGLDPVPLGAQHLARERAARLRREPHDELRRHLGRLSAALPLLERALVELLARLLGTGRHDGGGHLGHHGPGRDGVHLHAVVGQLARQRLGELHDGRLGRRIRAHPRRDPGPSDATAREVHDLAAALLSHVRQDCPASVHRPEDVHLEREPPLGRIALVDPADRAIDPGVVHEDIDRAPSA